MSEVSEGSRELLVSTGNEQSGAVLVAVRDSGPGLDPASLDQLFDAFYTTKPGGMGMGLSICRSIVEVHRGGSGLKRTDRREPHFNSPSLGRPRPDLSSSGPQSTRVSEADGPGRDEDRSPPLGQIPGVLTRRAPPSGSGVETLTGQRV